MLTLGAHRKSSTVVYLDSDVFSNLLPRRGEGDFFCSSYVHTLILLRNRVQNNKAHLPICLCVFFAAQKSFAAKGGDFCWPPQTQSPDCPNTHMKNSSKERTQGRETKFGVCNVGLHFRGSCVFQPRGTSVRRTAVQIALLNNRSYGGIMNPTFCISCQMKLNIFECLWSSYFLRCILRCSHLE